MFSSSVVLPKRRKSKKKPTHLKISFAVDSTLVLCGFFCVPAKNTWTVQDTKDTNGALIQGGYGHSSVFDPGTRAVYIHGGYKAFSANKYGLAGDLYKYDVDQRKW